MTDRNRTLTTTAYALLGLLDIRPWTTYALAKQVARSLRLIWPRAESNVYEGPKALVAHGLATAQHPRCSSARNRRRPSPGDRSDVVPAREAQCRRYPI
jgi:DNA-binding PadR family transcriptional regulator